MNIENGKDKLKQITDQFGEKQTFSPSYEIVLPEGYNNLNWVEKIKDAESLRIQNCQQITDFAPLEQLDNLTQLYLLDAEKFNSKSFSTLGKITKIDTLNKKFDPNLHQAMMEIENNDLDEGVVVQEIQTGYMMHDRLLRPAMVGVSKKSKQENETAVDQDSNSDKEDIEKDPEK